MPPKTSQLQIRVTEQEKAALRRLAAAANMTVSRYVLSQAIPSRARDLERIGQGLSGPPTDQASALQRLVDLVVETPPADYRQVLGGLSLEGLPPRMQNQVAAVVESGAQARGTEPPDWVDAVDPLPRPYFWWPLASLRPHQMRVAPVAYKKRGIFFDPASQPELVRPARRGGLRDQERPEYLGRLHALNSSVRSLELKVEFYLLGGAILSQSFHARPTTARIDALFRPESEATNTIADLARREGWGPDWLADAVKACLAGGLRPDRYLELDHLSVFVPPAEYVLALKVAALRLGAGARTLDDLRYVVRALNLKGAADVLELTARYFGPRQIPSDARSTLERLLAA